jgi:lipopolysaccharide transport system ATP-binding protein
MSDAIFVDGLSKQYVIGANPSETMLRERLAAMVRNPFRPRPEPRSIWALRDVSFTVGEAEVVGIIGRNGAGKSTLLKILSKITHPTRGHVRTRGHVASLLEVGTGFHEELTGRENIYLNGSILGMKKRDVDARLDEIIAFAGVDQFIDTPIKRYSSGMRLRLGFSVAAHLDPDILIIDEVLAVGDAGFQRKCLNRVGELRSGGRTVLFVSHNLAAVENLCSRGIWIDQGKLTMDGPARDVIQAYLGTFVEAEVGGTQLAQIEKRLGTGEIRFTGIEFLTPEGQPQSIARGGEPLVIRLHYKAHETVAYPSFGLRMYTEMGTLIAESSTWHHAIAIPQLSPGEGYLDLELKSLNLLTGSYTLSLWITGETAARVYDGLEYCTRLEVESTNLYRSSRLTSGVMFFPQEWNLDNLSGTVRPSLQANPSGDDTQ